jgi:uncharacterized protein (TIGR00730 family)
MKIKRICVFCGSSAGRHAIYAERAREVGELIAERGLELVYGGAQVGLMGIVANAALTAGAHAIGVIPQSMVDREIAHAALPDLRIVATMHERKALMESLSDAFLALPGGMGTLEEVCEIYTWGQLGLHAKPCGLLNVDGYYAPFLQLLDNAVEAGFLRPAHRSMVLEDTDPARLLDRFDTYRPAIANKWITRETT